MAISENIWVWKAEQLAMLQHNKKIEKENRHHLATSKLILCAHFLLHSNPPECTEAIRVCQRNQNVL